MLSRLICGTLAATLLVGVAVMAAAAPPGAAGATAPRCGVSGAHVVAASARLTVVRKRGRTYACRAGSSRRVALGDEPGSGTDNPVYARNLALAGRFVGYEVQYSDRQGAYSGVVVLDVERRRRVVDVAALGDEIPEQVQLPRSDADGGVSDLVLLTDGSVAWIARYAEPEPDELDVMAVVDGRFIEVAAGPNVRPGSLARTGRRLYWMDGDAPRTSVLP